MADSRLAKWYITAELTALRAILGLSEAGLARALGVSAATIRNWESGKTVPLRSVAKDIGQMAGVEQSRIDFLCFVIDNYKVPGLVANLHTRNVRMVEQAERTYGSIFKFEPEYIPGPLQLPGYQDEVLPSSGNEHAEARKRRDIRGKVLKDRTGSPRVELLIGYNALRHLREMTHWDRQIESLLKASERPNWEVRVIDGLHRGSRGNFDRYEPAGFKGAGPGFVYTESLDQSRYLEDEQTLAWYDGLRREIWEPAKPIKEIFSGGIQLLA